MDFKDIFAANNHMRMALMTKKYETKYEYECEIFENDMRRVTIK